MRIWPLSLLSVLLALLTAVGGGRAESTRPAEGSAPASDLKQRAEEVATAVREYRTSLEKLLALQEGDLARLVDQREQRRRLLSEQIISRREFEASERAAAAAQEKVDETTQAIAATEHALAEAQALETAAVLPPLPQGGQQETATLVVYTGAGPWSLPAGTARLQQFYSQRFGRALPISAYGQTALHDRLGFAHQQALDVAVHPDSEEGRALMDYLRTTGIPFIASRGAVPGSSSGAHIHVGQPSPRITAVR